MKSALIIIVLMFSASLAYAADPALVVSQAEKDWWISELKAPALTTVTKELSTIKLTVKTRDGKLLVFNLPAIKIGVQGKIFYLLSKEVMNYSIKPPTGGT